MLLACVGYANVSKQLFVWSVQALKFNGAEFLTHE